MGSHKTRFHDIHLKIAQGTDKLHNHEPDQGDPACGFGEHSAITQEGKKSCADIRHESQQDRDGVEKKHILGQKVVGAREVE